MKPIIVWFRQDLRLTDNPSLAFAARCGRPIICLYILDDETPGEWMDMESAILSLAPGYRAVLVLHDVEGFTHGEIGEMLGIPEGTARSDLHHARAALRRLLKDVRSDL